MLYKKINSIVLLTLASLTPLSAHSIDQSGKINFVGYIYSATCQVDINSQGPNNATVNMGRYSTSLFSKAGTVVGGAGETGQINISLINCPDQGTLSVTLNGTTEANNSQILALQGASKADGVGIHIYRQDKLDTPLTLDGSQTIDIPISNPNEETPELKATLIAKYVSTKNAVSAGDANSEINYTIKYN